MQKTGIQYTTNTIHHTCTFNMLNLKTNFGKFFIITKSVHKDHLKQSQGSLPLNASILTSFCINK
jgi:hypothetical protein